jgi:hypothetical protein
MESKGRGTWRQMTRAERDMLKSFGRLAPEQRRKVLAMAKEIVRQSIGPGNDAPG